MLKCFRHPADYRLFVEKLAEFSATYQVQVRSYCLMPYDLLRRYHRNHEGRQVLLYLGWRYCRGRYSLTEIGERLGGISVGALSRAGAKLRERKSNDEELAGRVREIVGKL